MLRRCCVIALAALAPALVFCQTPQPIQQRQMADERALQRESLAREQQQHQAQIEQVRRIDRQQEEEQRQQARQQAEAQAAAAQQRLYQIQQAEEQARATAQTQGDDQSQAERRPPIEVQQPNEQPQQLAPSAALRPSVAQHWSYRNISTRDKVGLGALGVLLAALAFPAGIVPARFARRRVGRLFAHRTQQ